MATFVLIDNKALKILKGAASVRQLECWADIVCKKNDFLIVATDENRCFSPYRINELALIYHNTSGDSIPPGDYGDALRNVRKLASSIPDDPATHADLVKRLKGKEPEVDPRPTHEGTPPYNPEKDPKASKDRAKASPRSDAPHTAPKRPREGTTTARVWDIADILHDENPSLPVKELRAKIVAACVEGGIDSSTAATQYSKWKRATLPK